MVGSVRLTRLGGIAIVQRRRTPRCRPQPKLPMSRVRDRCASVQTNLTNEKAKLQLGLTAACNNGIEHYFAVPGEIPSLLDQLLTNSQLKIGCCNELNAGYAVDAHAKRRGIAVVVTFSVGASASLMRRACRGLAVIVLSGLAQSRHRKPTSTIR